MNTPKPQKPATDFPLFAHASGKWAKKINGQTIYFGRWADPGAALEAFRAFLAARRSDTVSPSGLTVRDACNRFLGAKDHALQRRELSQSSFADYRRTCSWLAEFMGHNRLVTGLTPSDFSAYKAELATRRSAGSLGNEIIRVRVLFKWCWDSRLIAAPIHFGPEFRRPGGKVLRKHRREAGKKLFSAAEIHRIMNECGLQLRAMILLGINAGFGNNDCTTLPVSALDLSRSWLSHHRPKTEIEREIPLWPETVAAIQQVIRCRPDPRPEYANRVFIRNDGRSWEGVDNLVAKRTRVAILASGMARGGFYWLRHTFATIAGATKDQVAVDAIMGHSDHRISATYREEIADDRLLAVTNHVRAWLFGK